MPVSKRFLHPEAISQISNLELRARKIVEGFLSGMHRSPYFGHSVEFLQHREYVAGDDVRDIDWKVWAKQERYYIKQYEEDTNLRTTLLVDVSSSMQYGSGHLTKYEYACTAAVSLAYLMLKQQDGVGCVAFDEAIRGAAVPIRSKRNHLFSIIESLDNKDPKDKTDLSGILTEVAQTYPKRGLMILFSDLFTDLDQLMKGLRNLRQRNHEVIVFHLLDDDELDFPFNGPTRFEGLETIDTLNCNPRALREGYMESLNRFLTETRRLCAKTGIDYVQVRTSDSLEGILSAFLNQRQSVNRR